MNSNPVKQSELDLLAEGELNCNERRHLIERLSREPDGWKRCAMAFLEVQALTGSIDSLVQQGLVTKKETKSAPTSERWGGRMYWRPIVAVLAASLLLVIGFYSGLGMAPTDSINADLEKPGPELNPVVRTVDEQTMREVSLQFASVQIPDSEIVGLANVPSATEVQFVPIIRSPRLEQQLSILPQPKLNQHLDKNLEQAGWKIVTQRQLLAVKSPNGEQQIYPIDSVNYEFVGRQTF